MKKVLMVLCGLTLLNGCSKDEKFVSAEEQLAIDIVKIDNYLVENSITALPINDYSPLRFEGDTGLRYVIDVEGIGASPDLNNIVVVKYEGRLLSDGTVFDTSENSEEKKFEALLGGGLIDGWKIGIPFLKEGGSGTLYIPSGWAYGRNGRGTIPGNAILIFDIELLEVK